MVTFVFSFLLSALLISVVVAEDGGSGECASLRVKDVSNKCFGDFTWDKKVGSVDQWISEYHPINTVHYSEEKYYCCVAGEVCYLIPDVDVFCNPEGFYLTNFDDVEKIHFWSFGSFERQEGEENWKDEEGREMKFTPEASDSPLWSFCTEGKGDGYRCSDIDWRRVTDISLPSFSPFVEVREGVCRGTYRQVSHLLWINTSANALNKHLHLWEVHRTDKTFSVRCIVDMVDAGVLEFPVLVPCGNCHGPTPPPQTTTTTKVPPDTTTTKISPDTTTTKISPDTTINPLETTVSEATQHTDDEPTCFAANSFHLEIDYLQEVTFAFNPYVTWSDYFSGVTPEEDAFYKTRWPMLTDGLTRFFQFVDGKKENFPSFRFGFAQFTDKPEAPFGQNSVDSCGWSYHPLEPYDNNRLKANMENMYFGSGLDFIENHLDYMIRRSVDSGFTAGIKNGLDGVKNMKVLLIVTDKIFHEAPDRRDNLEYSAESPLYPGQLPPEDSIPYEYHSGGQNPCLGYEYPHRNQTFKALTDNGVNPVVFVTNNEIIEQAWAQFIDELYVYSEGSIFGQIVKMDGRIYEAAQNSTEIRQIFTKNIYAGFDKLCNDIVEYVERQDSDSIPPRTVRNWDMVGVDVIAATKDAALKAADQPNVKASGSD